MPENRTVILHGADGKWEAVPTIPKGSYKGSIITPRKWQEEAFNALCDSDRTKTIAPTGSGKGIAIIALACNYLLKGKTPVIAVPLNIIKNGFMEPGSGSKEMQEIVLPNGKRKEWDPINLSEEDDGVINELISRIKDSGYKRPIIVSHMSLALLFDKISKSKELEILKNDIVFFIDEFHHVANSSNGYSNQIGKLCAYLLKNDLPLHVCTATPFRGDRGQIIPEEYEDTFKQFIFPYDRHFSEICNGLEFSYDFLISHNDYIAGLKNFYKNHDIRKDLIFLPHPGEGVSTKCKHKAVSDILKILSNGSAVKKDGNIYRFDRNGREILLVDLVGDGSAKERKDAVSFFYGKDENGVCNNERVDVVLGIYIPKEGFDWPATNRVFIVGKKNLTDLMQRIGRGFRSHKSKENGKTKVEIYHFLSDVDKKKIDEDSVKEDLNNVMKAIYCSMIMELVVNPINIKMTIKGKDGKKKKVDINEHIIETVGSKLVAFWEAMEDVLIKLAEEEDKGVVITEEKHLEEVGKAVAKFGFKDNLEEIAGFVLKTNLRKGKKCIPLKTASKMTNGFDVADIDVELVKKHKYVGWLFACGNVLCGAKNLSEFRDLIGLRDDFDDMLKKVKKFVVEKGRLPNRNDKIAEEKKLGWWCQRQRNHNKKGIISKDKFIKLESIPWWKWDVLEEEWIHKLNILKTFLEKNKKFPSARSENAEDKRLGDWLCKQRLLYKNGELSEEKIFKLESVSPEILGFSYDGVWVNNLLKFKDFIKMNSKFPCGNCGLQRWGETQRQLYKKNKLTNWKIKKIESIQDWKWDVFEDSWNNNFLCCKIFKEKKWIFPNRRSEFVEEKKLGLWVQDQRKGKKKGTLSQEKIQLLESIPGWTWEGRFNNA